MMRLVSFVVAALTSSYAWAAGQAGPVQPLDLEHDQIVFRYQRNVEPWEEAPCKHEKDDVGLHGWDVYCKIDGVVHKYGVHLLLNFYPRTNRGVSAYEMLYWVTDRTDDRTRAYTSTTLWVHNSETGNRVRVIEAAQGVENDLASLRLEVTP